MLIPYYVHILCFFSVWLSRVVSRTSRSEKIDLKSSYDLLISWLLIMCALLRMLPAVSHVRGFMSRLGVSCPDFRAFVCRLSCVHVQNFVRSCRLLCVQKILCVQKQVCPYFCLFMVFFQSLMEPAA